jgi:hypothetical protein
MEFGMSRARSGYKRTETRALALTRRQRRRQSGAPARDLPGMAAFRAVESAETPATDAFAAQSTVAQSTVAQSTVAQSTVAQSTVAQSTVAQTDAASRKKATVMAGALAGQATRVGRDAGVPRTIAMDKGTYAAAEDGDGTRGEDARGSASGEDASEAKTPRPGASASSQKHPTLALMAELAARESASGPLGTPPSRATATGDDGERPDLAEADESVARADMETPAPTTRGAETHPMRAVRRAAEDMETRQDANVTEAPAPHISLATRRGHRPFPAPDLVLVTTGGHAALAALAAFVGAALTLDGSPAALTLLAFAALAGCSGGLAYLLDQQPATRRTAGMTLVCAQVGMVVWAMALIGPHAALLVLTPALAVLAARMVSWGAAAGQTVAILVTYLLFVWMDLSASVTPLLALRGAGAEALDAGVVVAGVLIAVAALHGMTAARERTQAMARAREHEARMLRATLARERQRAEDDAEALHQALSAGLRRRSGTPVRTEGSLGLLAMTVNRTLERLAQLSEDREERRRLEGALEQLTRVLERSWLGLPWSWPEASGTPVDEVVSLLRAPRPQDVPAATWPDDAPTLISLPTLSRLRALGAAQPTEESRTPGPAALAAGASGSGSGWILRRRPTRLAEVTPPETGISSPRWSLHEAEDEDDDGER